MFPRPGLPIAKNRLFQCYDYIFLNFFMFGNDRTLLIKTNTGRTTFFTDLYDGS